MYGREPSSVPGTITLGILEQVQPVNKPRTKRPFRYPLYVVLYFLVTVAILTQLIGSLLGIEKLAIINTVTDGPLHESTILLAVIALVGVLVGKGLYLKSLRADLPARPRFWVGLNIFSAALLLASCIITFDMGVMDGLGLISYIAGSLALVLPFVVWIMFERAMIKLSSRMQATGDDRDWRRMATRSLRIRMMFQPGRHEDYLDLAMLYYKQDEFEKTLDCFAMVGEEELKERQYLLALERCHRQQKNHIAVLEDLERLIALDVQPSDYERKLAVLLVLERDEEALALLESGNVPANRENTELQMQLNLKLGNFAQALAQTRRIAEQEKPPYPLTIRLYRELQAKYPENPEVLIQLGELLMQMDAKEANEEGAELFEHALALDPQRTHIHRLLAKYFYENRMPGKALCHLKELIDAYDTDPEIYAMYARIAADEQDWERVITANRQLLEIYPDHWESHARIARAYRRQRQLEEAQQAFEQAETFAPEESLESLRPLREDIEHLKRELTIERLASSAGPGERSVDEWRELIVNLIEVGESEKAVEECDALLDAHPDRLAMVEEMMREAIEHAEKNYLLRDFLSGLYYRQGRFNEALDLFREMAEQSLNPARLMIERCEAILTRAPDHLEARFELGLAYREVENWEGVLKAFSPLIDKDTDPQHPIMSPEHRALWVEAAFKGGQLKDAAPVALELVESMADQTGFMLMVIEMFDTLREYERSAQVFERAWQATPKEPRLARIANRVAKNRDDARLEFLAAKDAKGELTHDEHFEKAELHQDRGDYRKAIAHFQRAAEGGDRPALALARLAVTLCDQGMYDLADEMLDGLELTRETADAHPELKQMIYQVARELERSRDKESALKYYKRIFRVDASYERVVERIEHLS